MSAFNFIGGIIFGTIILSGLWFIMSSAFNDSKEKGSSGSGTIAIVVIFIVMVITAIFKCSSK